MTLSQNDKGYVGVDKRKEQLENELEQITKKEEYREEQGEDKKKQQLEQKRKEISEELKELTKMKENIEKCFEEANNEYPQWEASRAVIESQIRTYFPEIETKGVEKKREEKLTWSSFSEDVGRFYADIEGDYSDVLSGSPKRGKWGKKRENVLKEKEIVEHIQKSSVSGLSEILFRHFIRKFIPKHREKNT